MSMFQYLDMDFDWDKAKALSNVKKHGVTFKEAMTVFSDDNAVYIADKAYFGNEERFNVLGQSEESNLLMVCHCYRDNSSVIRIISARKSTKTETKLYGGAL